VSGAAVAAARALQPSLLLLPTPATAPDVGAAAVAAEAAIAEAVVVLAEASLLPGAASWRQLREEQEATQAAAPAIPATPRSPTTAG